MTAQTGDRVEHLRQLALQVRGRAYGDRQAEAIMDTEDWQDWWPTIRGGRYTGDITADSETHCIRDSMVVDLDTTHVEDGGCPTGDN